MTNEAFIKKLQGILALTTSPIEGEAQAAAEMLQKLLTSHNLSMADLEMKGAAAPGVREEKQDLGKAAFQWKLDLARGIADHYFCHAIINYDKTITFIGRPDNIESLKMLYAWLVDQIKRIAKDARTEHLTETGEHIDPLRWQVNFGMGAVDRLIRRLAEAKVTAPSTTALVLHHKSEISDYMEEHYGRRIDGVLTKYMRGVYERIAERERIKGIDRNTMTDEEYYAKYPSERPETPEEAAKRARREARRTGRRGRSYSAEDYRKMDEADAAQASGRRSADKINLSPFVTGPSGGNREIR